MGRVTKKLSQEFSRTENRILGALARLDDLETSRNAFSVNQGTNEDDSQSDPHPEAGLFHNQLKRNSDPKDGHDIVTGVQKERLYGHDKIISAKSVKIEETGKDLNLWFMIFVAQYG